MILCKDNRGLGVRGVDLVLFIPECWEIYIIDDTLDLNNHATVLRDCCGSISMLLRLFDWDCPVQVVTRVDL